MRSLIWATASFWLAYCLTTSWYDGPRTFLSTAWQAMQAFFVANSSLARAGGLAADKAVGATAAAIAGAADQHDDCCNACNRGALSADTLRVMGDLNARFIGGGLKSYRALP